MPRSVVSVFVGLFLLLGALSVYQNREVRTLRDTVDTLQRSLDVEHEKYQVFVPPMKGGDAIYYLLVQEPSDAEADHKAGYRLLYDTAHRAAKILEDGGYTVLDGSVVMDSNRRCKYFFYSVRLPQKAEHLPYPIHPDPLQKPGVRVAGSGWLASP